MKNLIALLFLYYWYYKFRKYDIIGAKEKQATAVAGICFSCAINEQTACVNRRGSALARVCECIVKKKDSRVANGDHDSYEVALSTEGTDRDLIGAKEKY